MAVNIFSSCAPPFTTGCFLYTDSGLTTPVANGIYSDGTNTYNVTGGAGEITSVGTCASASTTTTTSTTTTVPSTYITIGANYLAPTEMELNLSITGFTPAYAFNLALSWCTDSGASGTTTFEVNSGNIGSLNGANVNLNLSGDQSTTELWGDNAVSVDVPSPSTFSAFYVKGATITFVSGDPSNKYYVTYDNADSSCTPTGLVSDLCVYNC